MTAVESINLASPDEWARPPSGLEKSIKLVVLVEFGTALLMIGDRIGDCTIGVMVIPGGNPKRATTSLLGCVSSSSSLGRLLEKSDERSTSFAGVDRLLEEARKAFACK